MRNGVAMEARSKSTGQEKGSSRSLGRVCGRGAASDAAAVFAGPRVDLDLVALRHEERHADLEAGGDLGRLENLARGVALDGRLGPGVLALGAGSQFDRDRLAFVE